MMLCNDRKIDTVVIGLILKPVLMALRTIMHLSDTTHFLLSVVMEGKLARDDIDHLAVLSMQMLARRRARTER